MNYRQRKEQTAELQQVEDVDKYVYCTLKYTKVKVLPKINTHS